MIQQKNYRSTLNGIKNWIFLLLFIKSNITFSQNDIKLSSSAIVTPPPSPANVQATDGTFPDRIDISWQYMGGEYRVYRSENASNIGKPISTAWQKSNYLSDRSTLQSGKKYYYRVKMRRNGRESEYSQADAGHLMPIAGGRIQEEESPATMQPIDISINSIENDTLTIGKPFDLTYMLQNKGKNSTKLAQIRFYLSENDAFDTDDILLQEVNIPPLSIGRIKRGAVSLTIPKAIIKGNYFLIMRLDKQEKMDIKTITIQ